MPTQLLIDGHSLLFRAYHALPPLATQTGIPTGAIHGFTSMLLKVVDQEKPDRLVVVFDAPEVTFRHEQYEAYKAQREEAPDDFRQQVPHLVQLLESMGVPVLAVGGFEADDTLGTLAVMGEERGYRSLIVTGDRDLLQLVNEATEVLLTLRSGISDLQRMNRVKVKEKMGVWPEQIPDLKGLMGDGSDNIPGVPGIGQKSAIALLEQYGSIEEIIQHLNELSNPRWHSALAAHQEEARRYRDLATIVTTVPIDWPTLVEPFQWKRDGELVDLLGRLELHQVQQRLGLVAAPPQNKAKRAPQKIVPALMEVNLAQFAWECDEPLGLWAAGDEIWVYHPRQHYVAHGQWQDLPRPSPAFVSWGVKSLYRAAYQAHRPLPQFVGDVKLAAYLLDSERREYDLEKLGTEWGFPQPTSPAERVQVLWHLEQALAARLKEQDLDSLYQHVELPLARVLARMEAVGVAVDPGRLEGLGHEVLDLIRAKEEDIFRHAGMAFNINSQRQLGEVLFDRLGLPALKKTKTGWSTDAETLENLRMLHPIVDDILEYRQLVKIHGTYVEGLLPLIGTDGRLHTTFHQTVTATGRLSSSDPNLQNIPVRLPLGRRVRSVFVPSPRRIFVAADYSQIELRMLAHLAGDDNLRQAFWEGEDIHRRTASEIFNVPLEAVDETWRSRAKAVNFGIIYGISDFGLSRDTGVSRSEARDYIDRYYQRYPSLKEFFESVLDQARNNGYVKTILGRRRWLPDILSKNRARRQYAERMAMNTVIQGSAADLIKVAMVRIDAEMQAQAYRSDMIIQVHDELIWDAVVEEARQLVRMATDHMKTALTLTVPLVVEVKWGHNWEQMMSWETYPTDA
ncbi:MAG: DNA polymerase I [Firmicutes bacterium]|nr:DNA polymerase I [Bacillota bacterium]